MEDIILKQKEELDKVLNEVLKSPFANQKEEDIKAVLTRYGKKEIDFDECINQINSIKECNTEDMLRNYALLLGE
jgi:hypothetical protein|nr:MAG TPA: hypothetical protein [Caudoviricetes sp.]